MDKQIAYPISDSGAAKLNRMREALERALDTLDSLSQGPDEWPFHYTVSEIAYTLENATDDVKAASKALSATAVEDILSKT